MADLCMFPPASRWIDVNSSSLMVSSWVQLSNELSLKSNTLYLINAIFRGHKMARWCCLAFLKSVVESEVQRFDAGQPLPDLYLTATPPAGRSPVAAELNHCEHGRHSLFTCGLSPAAAQPGYGRPFLTKSETGVFVCKYVNQTHGRGWVS